ncbi:MAG: ATP-dependent DNA helicase PcrA [Candidatus Brocadia sp. AMX2]|uniref:DNA 3'-5' helicase n=1 Tax=Candidatus Brocadia sinica JPN1 TaxID=1197129 RepID=A0ABQ0JUQ8_9BACT|nr:MULTISPECIES: UvrD-helicase domain-containing protein [Brocadia]MBC6932799.1 ATP-dependent DNA helicase PcrA [Candidatus Brocadia sp.]MBL1169978.1 ATP-dependent DNA helicase PcrA [Candidatus Brocadia sp. AMX1]NOG41658.1 UvrD-helicase domain-containing protein [Planctomycetota bacterium]GIK14001.1 MAG: DNA helicase [Candidatus Brocadia sinica]KAA0244569.1 MAG: ATP-dependent DNA helicase PcrA [Candidatus Brocadia sp. AMX2]
MSLLQDVTDKQREAITHIEGPLLVVAGAGSGKTRVITRRIGYLMSQGVKPYNILAITFTNKASDEMCERVKQFSTHKGLWVSTFHKMCSRILRSNIDRLGYSRDFSIYDTTDQLSRVKSIMAELQLDTAQWKPRTIVSSISNAKNKLIDPETFATTTSGYYNRNVAQIYKKYQALLKANNALDFDDLLIKTIELFKTHPDILEMYQDKFRFILIDEYQDTNYSQYTITRLLANRYRNICVTGDPDQSIYGWRGADIRNIMDFEKDYPDARVVLLEQNYRSTKHILHAASSIIQQNKYRKQKSLWTENVLGEKIRVVSCENEHGEADEIARLIKGLNVQGTQYSDIALFYRTNAQSRVLEISLRNAGIPYTIVGGVEFYQRKEIKDILSYLRLCVNPHDEVALERAINTPTRGIGNTTVKKLEGWATAHGTTLFDAIQQVDLISEITGKSALSIKRFSELILNLQQLPRSPVENTIKQVIEKTNYFAFLRESGEMESNDRVANVEELVNAAHEYDINYGEGTLQGFLEEVALVSAVDELEDTAEAVTLMTLHTAKGLEFPVVFLTGMEDGLLPHSESNDSDEEIEEERRLCYVGITRAMKELFLTHAKRRMRYGQMDLCRPSRFLDEIPDEILDKIDRTNRDYSYNTYRAKNLPQSMNNRAQTSFQTPSNFDFYSDATDSASIAAGENPFSFSSGEVVRHPLFGIGRILEVSGSNEKASVKVSFNVGGTKHLMLAYAKLERVK